MEDVIRARCSVSVLRLVLETTQLQGSCCKESNSAFLSSLEMRAQRCYRLYIQIQNDSENRRVAVSPGLLILATIIVPGASSLQMRRF